MSLLRDPAQKNLFYGGAHDCGCPLRWCDHKQAAWEADIEKYNKLHKKWERQENKMKEHIRRRGRRYHRPTTAALLDIPYWDVFEEDHWVG